MRLLGGGGDLIGLDIGSSSIKLVQLTPRRDGYELVHAMRCPIPSEAIVDGALMDSSSIGTAVKTLMKNGSVKAKRAACSISGNAVIAKVVNMPSMGARELEEQIQWEAEQHIPFSINEVNLDYQVLARREGEMSVLLVAAKKEILLDYQNIVSEAGLELSIMDVGALAMYNAFHVNHYLAEKAELETSLVGLANVGAAMTSIVIVRAGQPVFLRDVPTGGNIVTMELQKGLGLSFEDAEAVKTGTSPVEDSQRQKYDELLTSSLATIAAEIQRTVEFYLGTAGEEALQKFYVTGGTTRAERILDQLREKLGISVEPLNPFLRVRVDGSRAASAEMEDLGAMASISVGLAVRRVNDAFNKS